MGSNPLRYPGLVNFMIGARLLFSCKNIFYGNYTPSWIAFFVIPGEGLISWRYKCRIQRARESKPPTKNCQHFHSDSHQTTQDGASQSFPSGDRPGSPHSVCPSMHPQECPVGASQQHQNARPSGVRQWSRQICSFNAYNYSPKAK